MAHVAPTYDEACVPDIQKWFEANYSMQFRNYPVDGNYLHGPVVIGTNEAV